MFRKDSSLTRDVHIGLHDGQFYYHVSIPFLRNGPQCLRCHGKRKDAPPDLQVLYPGEGGFNEKPGKLRAITALKVPMGGEYLIVFVVLVVSGIMLMFISVLILFNFNMRKQVNKEVKAHKIAMVEKQQLQIRLNQAQKMEAIGTLVGGIAHDFNNILSVILGYSEILKEDLQEESYLENIDQVIKAGNRAVQLVRQILCFSRQSEGEAASLKIGPHVKEIMKMLRASIPTTIAFKIDINDVNSNVFADPGHIHQIVTNLCTNAYQSMQAKGGILTVTLRQIELGVENLARHANVHPGKFIQLSVNDTGCGIPTNMFERIFEPYFTSKPVGEGTLDATAQTPNSVVHYKGQGHILVVDDEAALAELNSRILMSLGYKVTTKTAPQEALDLFSETPEAFDLVLTDQTMPNLTGLNMASMMLEIRPGIPVILCSGYSSVVNEEQALAAGIKAFVLKPITKVSIARLINDVLSED